MISKIRKCVYIYIYMCVFMYVYIDMHIFPNSVCFKGLEAKTPPVPIYISSIQILVSNIKMKPSILCQKGRKCSKKLCVHVTRTKEPT